MAEKNINENNKITDRIIATANVGWWEADFKGQFYKCSDFVSNLMGLDSNIISFAEFSKRIREDYRQLITKEFASIRFNDSYNQLFPIYGKGNEVIWIRSVMLGKGTEPDGNVYVLGTIQVEDETRKNSADLSLERLNNLIIQQNNISNSLMSFLQLDDISEVMENAFNDILSQFGGGRVYLIRFDLDDRTQSCIYEVADEVATSEIDRLQKIPFDATPWWTSRILSGLPVILSDINELPEEAVNEKELLKSQDIKSIMIVPLLNRKRDGVWGYLGIDIVDENYIWSKEDYQWFASISNIINICMQFHESENKIRRDKRDLEDLYRYMPMGYLRMKILYTDGIPSDYLFMDANNAFVRIMGLPEEKFIGKKGKESGFNVELDLPHLVAVMNTEKHSKIDVPWERNDRYYNVTLYSPLENEVVILFNDITDSVTAHKALEKSESLLRNIYKNLPVGIELYDRNGVLIDMNDKDLEIFGLNSKEDALGVNLFENPNIPEDLKTKLENHEDIDFSLNYNFDTIDGYFETINKGKIYLVTKVTCLYNSKGELDNYIFINIDNTETSNAYSKIQEFEDLFLMIGKIAQVGYARWNALTKEGYALSSWYENVGEIPGTPLNRIIGVHEHFHPEDRDTVLEFSKKAVRGEANHLVLDARIIRGEDHYTWTRINVIVKDYRPEEGMIEMVCVNFDITTLKDTEHKLVVAKEKAEESDRLKSAFLANMSHEIRTPLNAIVGFSTLLAETDDREERQSQVAIVQENNELLLQLISDILDLSKIEAGMFDFVKDVIDVRQLCMEIMRSMSIRNTHRVKLVFDESSPEYFIYGDKSRVTQIIMNFITNALKFTKEGSVTLGYELFGDRELKFYVKDTGIGIAEDNKKAIFDRFVKLNSFAQGTGLGLSICKSLVQQMHGRIGVESKLGEGSCFWFTHPYKEGLERFKDPDVEMADIDNHPVVEENRKPVILVAEDIDSNYLLISAILKNKSVLLHADNGKKAVDMHEKEHPDIILMDIKMPEMDGIEATRRIRETDRDVPIIAVTAFAFDMDRQKALDAGCNDYLAKPISATMLENIIKKWLK